MTGELAEAIGLVGGALMVGAYAYSNIARSLNFLLFNLLNLVGSGLMVLSLSVHFNLSAMVLEVVWGLIAAFGLIKALRGRRAGAA
jgi:hypothetical protein